MYKTSLRSPIQVAFLDDKHWIGDTGIREHSVKCSIPCTAKLVSGNDLSTLSPTPSNTEIPQIVLSSEWLDWSYVDILKASGRLRISPHITAPRQIYGVVSVGSEMMKHPVEEDLSKIDILIGWNRNSDVQITHADESLLKDFVTSDLREIDDPKELLGMLSKEELDKLPKLTQNSASVLILLGTQKCLTKDSWFSGLLNELDNHLSIDVFEPSCLQMFLDKKLASDTEHQTGHNFAIVWEDSLLPGYASERLWKSIKDSRDSIVLYFGHPSSTQYLPTLNGILEFTVSFPSPLYSAHMKEILGEQAHTSTVITLPSSNIVPVWSFPGGVVQMADYIHYLAANEVAFKSHFLWQLKSAGGVSKEFRNHISKSIANKESWVCRACEYYDNNFAYE